MFVVEDKFSF